MESSQEAVVTKSVATEVGVASRLLKGSASSGGAAAVVGRAVMLLDSLPVESNGFSQIRRRLVNAQRFLHSGEIGAAEFELSMVVRCFSGQSQ
jgi:hypothetical protein